MAGSEEIKSTLAGIFVGALFTLLKLPIPAPPVLSGVLGIFGVWLGHIFTRRLTGAN